MAVGRAVLAGEMRGVLHTPAENHIQIAGFCWMFIPTYIYIYYIYMVVSINGGGGIPIAGWFIVYFMEDPSLQMVDLGVALF